MTARITRRQFVVGAGASSLGLIGACRPLAGPGASAAPRVYRVGVVSPVPPTAVWDQVFLPALRERGWEPGQNLSIELRHANGGDESVHPQLVAELLADGADVLVTQGPLATEAAMRATTAVPIVLMGVSDPVSSGFVASYGHPGGNVTGVAEIGVQLAGKRLQLLTETVPGASRVAVLWIPSVPDNARSVEALQQAAGILGVQLISLEVRGRLGNDLVPAFEHATAEGAEALLLTQAAAFARFAPQIVDLAGGHRLPALYPARPYVEAGGLMSYGPSQGFQAQRVAYYVDRILRGTPPAELPVEQPMRFDFVINRKTADTLSLTIPGSILLQVTELID